jgi:hypothetical protein
MKSRFIRTVMAGLLFALAASSQAQQPGMDGQGPLSPKWETQNGISYVCGGIGADEAAAMKKEAPKHDLMVTFADTRGEFLGEAQVTIADSRGRQLLDTTCGGPIMLADFPKSGRYRVRADIAGRSTGGTVEVHHRAGVKILPLVWPREQVEPG